MTYSTVMTHLDLGTSNSNVLCVTADFLAHFKSHVIGINACQPMPLNYGDGGHYGLVDFPPLDQIEKDRAAIEKYRKDAEVALRSALLGKAASIDWRSVLGLESLSDYIAQQARAADLLVISSSQGMSSLPSSRRVAIGELVMSMGRPVLIVPPGESRLDLVSVVVAWKDTREARRAVADAVPMLRKAGRVTVVEIVTEADLLAARRRLVDVSGWLSRHGIAAEVLAVSSNGSDARRLDAIADDHGAGLLVAGAYGHSRLKEWAFGGVTRELLLDSKRCTLVSH